MKLTSRRVRGLVAAAFAVGAIVVPAVAALPANAATELTFWSWRPEDKAFYEEQIGIFQAANPDIKIKFTPYVATEYNAILATALTAGKGPDLLQLRPYGGMSALSDAGNFLPLTTKDVPALAKLAPGILAAAQGYTDKRQFGVPYAASVMGVWYNPELFAKAGIRQTPTTWDSFITTLNRLKAAGIQPLANSSGNPGNGPGLEQMHATIAPTFYGGNTFYNDLVAGKTTFTNKAYVDGLDAVKQLSKYFPAGHEGIDYNTARSLFATGKAAIYIGGNYELTYFKQVNPAANIGWFPAPAKSAGSPKFVTSWGDGSYAINAKTDSKAAAIKFLNFLASKSFGQAMADEIFTIPVAPFVKINDPVVAKINAARAQFSTPFLNVVGFRFGTPTSSNIIQPGLQKLVVGGTTSAALAKDIQTAVASWYKPLAGKE